MFLTRIRALGVLAERRPESPQEGDLLATAIRDAARAQVEALTIQLDWEGLDRIPYPFLEAVMTEISLLAGHTAEYRSRWLLVSGLDELSLAKIIHLLIQHSRAVIWVGGHADPYPDHPGGVATLSRTEVNEWRFSLIGDVEDLRNAVPLWRWAMARQGTFRADDVRNAHPEISSSQVDRGLRALRQMKLIWSSLPSGPAGGYHHERLHPDDMTLRE